MKDDILTAEAKEAIRDFHRRLRVIPGTVIAIVASLVGFMFNGYKDIAVTEAKTDARRDAFADYGEILKSAVDSAVKAQTAAIVAKSKAESAVEKLEKNLLTITQMEGKLKTKEGEISKISDDIKRLQDRSGELLDSLKPDIAANLAGNSEFVDQVSMQSAKRLESLEHYFNSHVQNYQSDLETRYPILLCKSLAVREHKKVLFDSMGLMIAITEIEDRKLRKITITTMPENGEGLEILNKRTGDVWSFELDGSSYSGEIVAVIDGDVDKYDTARIMICKEK